MTTAVSKLDSRNLSIVENKQENTQEVLASDIIVPRLLLTQKMSKSVDAKKAQPGDLVRSTTMEKLGDDTKGIHLIPLKMITGWVDEEKVGGKWEYRKGYDRNKTNEGLYFKSHFRDASGKESVDPFPGATEWRRVKTIGIYGLILEDVEAYTLEMKKAVETGEMPDLTKGLLPVLVTFRVMSFAAGQAFANHYANYESMRIAHPQLKSYGYAFELGCRLENGKKGTFHIFQTGRAKKISGDVLAQAERWHGFLNNVSAIQVDETDMDEESGDVMGDSKF